MCAVRKRDAVIVSHFHQIATSLPPRSQSLGRCIACQYVASFLGPKRRLFMVDFPRLHILLIYFRMLVTPEFILNVTLSVDL